MLRVYERSGGVLSIVGISILYRGRCCARSRCTYGVRLLCLRHEAIVRNVFWSDPNLGNGSLSYGSCARYKRTRSTDNTIHVSGMADRRAASTFDIFRLPLLAFTSPFLLLLFSSHPATRCVTRMCVSESNHGEQRAEKPDPMGSSVIS